MKLFFKLSIILLLSTALAACSNTAVTTSDITSSQDRSPVSATPDSPGSSGSSDTKAFYQTLSKNGVDWKIGRYKTGRFGDKLTIVSTDSDPKTFNPWIAEDAFSLELSNLLFGSLFDLDPENGQVLPDLALAYNLDQTKCVYTINLRKGIQWSDGASLNADDFLFTWNRIIAQEFGNPALKETFLIDGKLPECKKLSKYSLQITTPEPNSDFCRLLCTLKVAPRHIIEPLLERRNSRLKFKELWSAEHDLSTMVTSGPFKLFSFEPGQKIEFSRSENFYMLDRQGKRLPYLDRLVYLPAPNPGEVLLAFDRNEADIARFRPRDYQWLASQSKKENFKLYNLGPSQCLSLLAFNMNRRHDSLSDIPLVSTEKAQWFNDQNFRQAINHAINKEAVINSFFKGAGSTCKGLFALERSPEFVKTASTDSDIPNQNKNQKLNQTQDLNQNPVAIDSRNIKAAESALQKSGFVKHEDGFLYDSLGQKVEFKLSFPKRSKLYTELAASIKTDLKVLGITVIEDPLEVQQSDELMRGARHWEAQLISVAGDPSSPASFAALLCSNGKLHIFDQRDADKNGKITVSDRRPWEEEIDGIYKQAKQQFDPDERKKLYLRVEKILEQEVPFIYLLSPDFIVASRNKVANYEPTNLTQSVLGLHNPEEIFIAAPQADSGKIAGEANSQNRNESNDRS